MQEIGTALFRTLILYGLALLVFRSIGKRAMGKMAPFDVAVIIIIGEAVALGMEVKTPLLLAILPILLLGALQYGLSWLNLRSHRFEEVTQGFPTLIVKDGKPVEENLRHERVTEADLMMGLREQGLSGPQTVKEAYLEPTGKVSVVLQKASSAVTLADMVSSPEVKKWQENLVKQLTAEFQRLLKEEKGN